MASFFFNFVFTIGKVDSKNKSWDWGSLVSETTALPTVPKPLPVVDKILNMGIWMINIFTSIKFAHPTEVLKKEHWRQSNLILIGRLPLLPRPWLQLYIIAGLLLC